MQHNGITAVALPRLGDPSVIPLWFGEGDLVTPEFIRESAKQALDDGHTFYVHTRGLPALRSEIQTYLNNLYGVSLHDDRISVPGASMLCITIAAQMALRTGDDALIVSPHWPNIETACRVAGANIVTVRQRQTPGGWALTAHEIIDAVTPQTRLILVNSPCNPTGWVMSSMDQALMVQFCRERNIMLIADEVYHRHDYQRPSAPSFVEVAQADDPVVIVNGLSKVWAMTCWRVGWVVAPSALAQQWAIMSECFNTGANVVSQHGCITALREGEPLIAKFKSQYSEGRDLVQRYLGQHPGVELSQPDGAFYAFPKICGIEFSRAFAEGLLAEEDVAVAPGYTFGDGNDEYIRICFALSSERLEEGLCLMVRYIDRTTL
ncbi:MAG: aspartate aminotransferase [Candidatus Azotimanducaceae bacterium]|jgi:aspartate aminotransferase